MSDNRTNRPAQNGPRKKKKKNNTLKTILLILLLLLLALIVAATIFVVSTLNKINRVDPNGSYLSPEEAATLDLGDDYDPNNTEEVPDMTWPDEVEELIGEDDNITNILLIGQDRRPGEVRARSDAMILVSINKEKKTISMVSFLRDNYVQIPDGYMDNRLNAAFAFGGMQLLDDTLALNFGVKIDRNVEVDFESFTKVIDLVGGVDVELTAAEVEYMDPKGKLGLREGMNHLNGEMALNYSRIRKLDSDFGRTGRQRNVLNAVAASVKNMSISDVLTLANEVLPMLTTDMSNSEMIKYVTEFLPILISADGINSTRVPVGEEYYYATIRGMSVVVPDLAVARQHLKDILT